MNLHVPDIFTVPAFLATVAGTATLLGAHTRGICLAHTLSGKDTSFLRKHASRAQIVWTGRTFQCAKYVLGISVNLDLDERTEQFLRTQPVLVISNHQSFLDVPFIAQILRSHGCTDLRWIVKDDIRRWPFIGHSCQLNGSAFVRRDLARAKNDLQAILDCAKLASPERASLAIFPEGTRFKTADPASPYQHVLPPHVGAIPTLIRHLPHHIVCSLTLHHHAGASGRTLTARMRSLTPREIGRDTANIRGWLTEEWARKDTFISGIIKT